MADNKELFLPRSHIGADGGLLVIAWPDVRVIGIDVALLDDISADGTDLVLEVGELAVALSIADGPEAAQHVAAIVAPYTRNQEIIEARVYEDASRRLAARRNPEYRLPTDFNFMIEDEPLQVDEDCLVICGNKMPISEVRDRAERAETLEFAGNVRLQAGLALLFVTATQQHGDTHDYETLTRRAAAYVAKHRHVTSGQS